VAHRGRLDLRHDLASWLLGWEWACLLTGWPGPEFGGNQCLQY
jgi:hypothetical protein